MIITGKKFSKPKLSRIINGDDVVKEAPIDAPKERLDLLMVAKYQSYNRSTLQKFIEAGFVTVDGVVVKKANAKFGEDAKIELNVPETEKNADLVPGVIYEDENVVVLNKPAGLLSMAKGEYCPEKTLEDYGLLVHRLDRDTSGVVILAKNPEVQSFLRKQFQDRKTHKTYYAVVEGRPKIDEANIDLPIARDLKHPTTFRVEASGKPSETYYKVVKTNDEYSLVELRPKTGRTHQLRVHMQYLGCPIANDKVYGEAARQEAILGTRRSRRPSSRGRAASSSAAACGMVPRNNFLPLRLMLHAYSLEITLPGGERRIFTAELPREFEDVFRETE